jgi:hypothetical protein
MDASRLLEERSEWQMSLGERAALTGMLAQIRPRLAVEIGTAEGGSLRRISEYAGQVHSFDLVDPHPDVAALPNVTVHSGDNHVLLPELLGRLEAEGANVDFALVDGDHSAEGVERDMRDLLDSPAVGNTLILMHDTMNPEVRRGLLAVDYEAYPKVRHLAMDFVAGGMMVGGRSPGEMWGGLGLLIVDAVRPRGEGGSIRDERWTDLYQLVVAGKNSGAGVAAPVPAAAPAAAAPVAATDAGSLEELRSELEALKAEFARHRYAFEVAEAAAGRLSSRVSALEG